MVRSVVGNILGILAGGLVVAIIELPGYFIHPLPPGIDTSDAAALKSHFEKAPLAALLGVAIAWTIGPLVGALVAGLIVRRAFLFHGLIIGVIFLVLDMINVFSFPHPLWLAVVGVIAPLVSGYIGSLLAARVAGTPSTGPQPYDMREKNMAC